MNFDSLLFLLNTCAALTGGFVLWGWLMSLQGRRRKDGEPWQEASKLLLSPALGSLFLMLVIYFVILILHAPKAQALHEFFLERGFYLEQLLGVELLPALLLSLVLIFSCILFFAKKVTPMVAEIIFFFLLVFLLVFLITPICVTPLSLGIYWSIQRLVPIFTLGSLSVYSYLLYRDRAFMKKNSSICRSAIYVILFGLALSLLNSTFEMSQNLDFNFYFKVAQLSSAIIILTIVFVVFPWLKIFQHKKEIKKVYELEILAGSILFTTLIARLIIGNFSGISISVSTFFVIYAIATVLLWLIMRLFYKKRYDF